MPSRCNTTVPRGRCRLLDRIKCRQFKVRGGARRRLRICFFLRELPTFVQGELPCGFFDHPRRHRTEMLGKSISEPVFAEEVYHAGNSLRIKMHGVYRVGSKDRVSRGTADTQPLRDVSAGLRKSEWPSVASERNSLPELPKFRPLEFVFKLRLTRKHDLQHFFGGSLQIEQEPDFLQQLERQALRFVDDQHRAFACAKTFDQPCV